MWSGSLTNTTNSTFSDEVVLLINGADTPLLMNASLADIFVDSGPKGTAKEVKISWEVRDLWVGRMNESQAAGIIGKCFFFTHLSPIFGFLSTAGCGIKFNDYIGGNGTYVGYNATKTSYREGLAARDPRLLGNVTTTVLPSGTVQATVPAHGAKMFRLRPIESAVKKRDEL